MITHTSSHSKDKPDDLLTVEEYAEIQFKNTGKYTFERLAIPLQSYGLLCTNCDVVLYTINNLLHLNACMWLITD